MIVLHGIWIPSEEGRGVRTHARISGKVSIWGETPSLQASPRRSSRQITKAKAAPRPHPFPATSENLLVSLSKLTRDSAPQGDPVSGDAETLRLLLPSVTGKPISSWESIREKEAVGDEGPYLSAWEVPCVSLSAAQGLSLLALLPEEPESELRGVTLAVRLPVLE